MAQLHLELQAALEAREERLPLALQMLAVLKAKCECVWVSLIIKANKCEFVCVAHH